MSRTLTALLATIMLLPSCGARERVAGDATTRDSAGVAIITSGAPAWSTGEGWQVDSVPITVIGADEQDVQQQWQYVQTAARRADGSVVVAIEGSIRLFGADGRFVQTISQAGQGPGEFRYLSQLLPLPGDTLRASDGFGYQVAWFAPDGALLREERVDRERVSNLGPWSECNTAFLADGSRLGCKLDPSIPLSATNRASKVDEKGWSSPGPGLLRQLRRVWIAAPALDTAFPLGIDAGIEQFGVTLAPGMEEFVVHPFHGRSVIASGGSPLRIAIATNPDYRVEWWTPTGTLERIIQRPGARLAPSEADLAGAQAYLEAQMERMDPVMRSKVLAEVPTPDSLPAVYGMVVSPAGELLIQRSGLLPSQPTSSWDVFGADGTFLGEIRISGHVRLLAAGTDYLLAIRRTDDDASLVEVYRLRR